MRNLIMAVAVFALGLSAQAGDGDIVDTKVYDVYKNTVEVAADAEGIKIYDFKLKKAKSKRVRYMATCRRGNGGDHIDATFEEYECIKTRYERVLVGRVKWKFMTEKLVCTGGGNKDRDCNYEMVASFKKFNVRLSDVDAGTMTALENRSRWFPKRSKFAAMANNLFSLNMDTSRGNTEVKISKK